MRAVLSATLAKADFIARLQPVLGDGLNIVDGEPAVYVCERFACRAPVLCSWP